jgi:hypothetical protein
VSILLYVKEDEIDPHSRLYSSDAATVDKGQLLSDMDIVMGDKKALSQRVSELMVAYVRMIEKDKSALDLKEEYLHRCYLENLPCKKILVLKLILFYLEISRSEIIMLLSNTFLILFFQNIFYK